jgi:alcohol dehydrogenase class IV
MAQPIGAMYNIPHGDACSIFLPLAMEFNFEYATKKYADIANALDVAVYGTVPEQRATAIEEVKRLRQVLELLLLYSLSQRRKARFELYGGNSEENTGHITCNPRRWTKRYIHTFSILQ